jgi:ATP-dependent RNA helicase DHX29
VKVVLSTNIAETGLTVPDVTFVIDTAKARELSYDPTLNLTVLREIVVSKSNCLQRRGRAGRTQAGIYYNILPKSAFDSLPHHRPPELMRLPLEGICLKARAILGNESGSLKDIFSESLDPPPTKNIEKALSLLKQLQAMTKSEELTPLGVHLSKLGLDVKLGKMLIYAVIFRCLDPILTISACLRYFISFKS